MTNSILNDEKQFAAIFRDGLRTRMRQLCNDLGETFVTELKSKIECLALEAANDVSAKIIHTLSIEDPATRFKVLIEVTKKESDK